MPTTYASHDTLGRMKADIRQLTDPIHVAVRRRIVPHDSLIDQLRDAATPGQSAQFSTIRRSIPGSRPPARLDAIEDLSTVYVGISVWHAKLALGHPPREADWQKAVLRMLPDAAVTLAPEVSDWLAVDVQTWWHTAATAAGWRPADLLKLR